MILRFAALLTAGMMLLAACGGGGPESLDGAAATIYRHIGMVDAARRLEEMIGRHAWTASRHGEET